MINNYYKGKPCAANGRIVRIVGEYERGSWMEALGDKFFTIPIVATASGTIFTTGLARLRELTEGEAEQMRDVEQYVIEQGLTPYAGKLPELFTEATTENIL